MIFLNFSIHAYTPTLDHQTGTSVPKTKSYETGKF